MKFLFSALMLVTLTVQAAQTRKPSSSVQVNGKAAAKLWEQLYKAQATNWEGDCRMGKCHIRGYVACHTNITDNRVKSVTNCDVHN